MQQDAELDGTEHQPPVTIKTVDGGPLQIKGPVRLLDHDGSAYEVRQGRTLFLCRCGKSRTKPFCDGTHAKLGFDACERAPASDSPPS